MFNNMQLFVYSTDAIASDESIRITPSLRSKRGQYFTIRPENKFIIFSI